MSAPDVLASSDGRFAAPWADPAELRNNAVKFTEKGEIVVAVRAQRAQRADDVLLHFRVQRHGHRADRASRWGGCSRAFQQADASTTRKFGGTGPGPGDLASSWPS